MNNLTNSLYLISFVSLLISCNKYNEPTQGALTYPLVQDISFNQGLLYEKVQLINETTIPYCLDKCIEMGLVENFSRAAGLTQGDYIGLPNSDEFLYKAIEAASYSLMTKKDTRLESRLDSIITILAAAQEPDGYLRTPQTIYWLRHGKTVRNPYWGNLNGDLELYCSGHLIEAAVAHNMATHKKNLLNIATKNADLICSLFGKDKKYRGVDMIPEIELALVRLYQLTGEKKYLLQAKYFIEERGDSSGHQLMGQFSLDHKPLKQQTEAVGHATFAAYLYSGAADLVNLGVDTSYHKVLKTLWEDIVATKMSINGGIGSQHDNEGFGAPYDLPDLTAYNEICAAVGFCNLNKRMFQLDQQSKYFDVLEHTLYNNLLSGLSLDGKSFFYVCPTESKPDYKFNLGWCPADYIGPYKEPMATRKEWLPCACCPPTLARFMSSLTSLVYASKGDKIYVNLYAQSTAKVLINGQNLSIKQITNYPWDGKVQIHLDSKQHFAGKLMLRIPAWINDSPIYGSLYEYLDTNNLTYSIDVDGFMVKENKIELGYAALSLDFKGTCTININFPMIPRKVKSDEHIIQNKYKYALQRGPILFCFEETDNGTWIYNTQIRDNAKMEFLYDSTVLGGCNLIRIDDADKKTKNNNTIKAIPYYQWSNRGENTMKIWLN
ncbi:MAG: beta-L-arabinofuranosidase domain-containing protein [Bacteroidota bacterium]